MIALRLASSTVTVQAGVRASGTMATRLSMKPGWLTPQFEFKSGRENVFHDYFDLKAALEQIVGRDVDLVVANAVKNPYIAKSIFDSAEDVYAA